MYGTQDAEKEMDEVKNDAVHVISKFMLLGIDGTHDCSEDDDCEVCDLLSQAWAFLNRYMPINEYEKLQNESEIEGLEAEIRKKAEELNHLDMRLKALRKSQP